MQSNKSYLATQEYRFRYDLGQAPLNTKILLLTRWGIAVVGHYRLGDNDILGWAPLPGRDPVKEKEMIALPPSPPPLPPEE